ncbi:MAG: signal peptidase II [bacterium]|nr:MAG: signal peptidase II [bacterium]
MIADSALFAALLAADRITKLLIPQNLDLHQSIPVIPGLFHITYVRNTGGAFGILAGWDNPMRRAFFILASVAALVLLAMLYRQACREGSRAMRLALAAIGSGAVGNLYDRVMAGEVVDFLDLFIGRHHWPAFNVADSAISVGAVILGYLYITGRAGPSAEARGSDAS